MPCWNGQRSRIVVNGVKRGIAMNQVRSGSNLGVSPTGDYGGWRSNLGPNATAAVAASENEAGDIVGSNNPSGALQGSSFGSVSEASAVASDGWGSDAHFNAIESGFSGNTDQDGLGQEGTDLGDVTDTSGNTGPDSTGPDSTGPDSTGGPSSGGQTSGGVDTAGGDQDFNKGGMPVRKNMPRVAMMNYSKGNK